MITRKVLSRSSLAYLTAVGGVGLVVVVRLVMLDFGYGESSRFLLMALPIVVAAWLGGIGPGLVAIAMSAVLMNLLFIEPTGSLMIADPDVGLALMLFILQGIVFTWLGHSRLRAMHGLVESQALLEQRVIDRTTDLLDAQQRLEEQLTRQAKQAAAIERANIELQRSNRELQDFASVASHDLQEPLRKIQAFGDRLSTRFGSQLSDEGRDYLSRMMAAAARMRSLINDLLTFSRVTTKASPFEPVDLDRIAAEVVGDLESRIESRTARLTVLPLGWLDADPMQMRQLLQNLIGNALKFTRPDVTPEVRVWAEAVEPAQPAAPGSAGPSKGERIRIMVADNGIGFDERYLDRIFNVFQRLHGRGTYEGTGIGLAVCRKIAERHGGTITARSAPDRGATFIVELPRHAAGDTPEQTQPGVAAGQPEPDAELTTVAG